MVTMDQESESDYVMEYLADLFGSVELAMLYMEATIAVNQLTMAEEILDEDLEMTLSVFFMLFMGVSTQQLASQLDK